jgi:hypothetical protein
MGRILLVVETGLAKIKRVARWQAETERWRCWDEPARQCRASGH